MNYLNKKTLILSLLTLTLGLNGCSNFSKQKHYISDSAIPQADINNNNIDSIDKFTNRTSQDLTNVQVLLSSDDYYSLLNQINNIKTEYSFLDLYNTDLYNLNIIETRSNAMSDDKNVQLIYNAESLKNVVLENNIKYLESVGARKSFYHDVSNDDLNNICSIIIETINTCINENPNINISDINKSLSNLKIFEKSSGNNAAISDDEILTFNKSMINALQSIHPEENDAFKSVITHEVIHLISKNPYTLQKDSGISIMGISTNYDYDKTVMDKDKTIIPLNWSWFNEAAAELKMCEITGNKPMVYQYMIGYFNSLKLVTLFSDNKSFEDINLEKDFNSFLAKFNIQSDEDKIELFNMMYSLEIIEKEPDNFFNQYYKKYGIDPKNNSDDLKNLKVNLKNSICTTLTKIFYSSLSQKIMNSTMNLADIFYLINIFESDLNLHINYSNTDSLAYYSTLVEDYNSIQINFFETISKNLNMNLTEITDLFQAYGLTTLDGKNNYTNSFLTSDQANFLNNKFDDYNKYAAKNIIYYNETAYSLRK